MTVTDMWGRVQGTDVLPLTHDGDDWCFPMPAGASGTLVCEFWAEDEYGNVGYRAALITLDKGAIKCWRWLTSGCDCIMLATGHPTATMTIPKPETAMSRSDARAVDITTRPTCVLRPHVCPLAGEA